VHDRERGCLTEARGGAGVSCGEGGVISAEVVVCVCGLCKNTEAGELKMRQSSASKRTRDDGAAEIGCTPSKKKGPIRLQVTTMTSVDCAVVGQEMGTARTSCSEPSAQTGH
jgi:hypothetical protein